jgi:hypothetical protein
MRRPGNYEVAVTTSWKEMWRDVIAVQPGRPSETVVVCPRERPKAVAVRWDVTWPEAARERKDLWYVIALKANVVRPVSGARWRAGSDERVIAFHPDGRRVDLALPPAGPDVPSTARHAIERLRQKSRPSDADKFWAGTEYEVSNAGVFRWDGEGPPAQMLATPVLVAEHDMLSRSVDLAALFPREHRTPAGRHASLSTPDAASRPRDDAVSWTLSVPETFENQKSPWSMTAADIESMLLGKDPAHHRGKTLFLLLDRNDDGIANPDEWSASRRIRPLFEEAGARLDKDMSEAEFLAIYMKAVEGSTAR